MPTSRSNAQRAVNLARQRGVVRLHEFEAEGIPRAVVARLANRGVLTRIARGLYTLPDRDFGENASLIQIAKLVPEAIVCLLSALRFHGLTTQNPSEVWIGIDRKARKPRLGWPPLRVVWWSGDALTEGVTESNLEGVPVWITTPARTVADCFKYRNKIGLDVALEALRDYRKKRAGSLDELHRAAAVCRVQRTIRTYLEAMT